MDRSAQDLVEQVRGIVDANRYPTLATADGDGPLGDTGLVCPRGLHRLPLGVATGGPPLRNLVRRPEIAIPGQSSC